MRIVPIPPPLGSWSLPSASSDTWANERRTHSQSNLLERVWLHAEKPIRQPFGRNDCYEMKKFIVLIIVASSLFGCVRVDELSEDNLYAPTYSGIGKEKTVFLAPMTINYKSFTDGEASVVREIEKQLESNGWRVATMDEEEYLSVSSAIVSRIGGLFSSQNGQFESAKFNRLLKSLTRYIVRKGDYGAIVFPSLILKPAELEGSYVHWDGVTQTVAATGRYYGGSWIGKTRGLSLELVVFSSSGDWMFTSYGGVALPYLMTYERNQPVAKLRDDMFEKPEDIAAGVRAALLPILNDAQAIRPNSGTMIRHCVDPV